MKNIKWLALPEQHDYSAALDFLCLLYKKKDAFEIVSQLKTAPISNFKSKDIFRASELSLLSSKNSYVKRDIDKIKAGIKMSPILLFRDSVNGKVIIADGYHRLCAVYSFNEDAILPCKIV